MSVLIMMLVTFFGFILAYNIYGKFLARKIFRINDDKVTPAVALEDGKDYVPSKKGVIFGHHFTSIAGTGPIVGPAIGIIWGWLPALLWVFLGSIIIGAVHDFGSLVISLRNEGKSISDITAKYINPRVRILFFLIVLLAIWIVIAIFGVVIAVLFKMYPQSVLAVWFQIPIAIILGRFLLKRGANIRLYTIFAVISLYAVVLLGSILPVSLPVIAGIPPTGLWSLILLVYCFIASTLPVTTLLQPRDFINAWQLVIAMGLMVIGVFASAFNPEFKIVAPVFQPKPAGAPLIWPFLFITIACGAISGFHALVSSGTTSKQLTKESDARFVGYGSMLLEGALAVLVIIAVSAGIGLMYDKGGSEILKGYPAWSAHYSSWSAASGLGSKVGAFVMGSANMIAGIGIPREIAVIIMGVFVASFAGTTLDTATRIQRYVIQELGNDIKIKIFQNKYIATAFAVVSAGFLAFSTGASGAGALTLWPLFGAVNQTLAALALITITIYLKTKGGIKYLISGIPAVFMVVMTVWALILNQVDFISKKNIILLITNGVIIVITVWMVFEGVLAFVKKKKVV